MRTSRLPSQMKKRLESKRAVQHTETSDSKFAKLLSNFKLETDKVRMHTLLDKYTDVFSSSLKGIGRTNVIQARIYLEGGHIVSQAPYRIPETNSNARHLD